MNLLEMVRYLRTSVLDDTGGFGIEWEDIENDQDEISMLRWSNEELTIFINESIRKVHRSIYDLKDHKTDFDVAVLATDVDSTYSIDSRIIKIVKARRSSDLVELVKLEIDDVWDVPDWETAIGKSDYYLPDYNTEKVTLYKKSSTDETIEFVTYREELVPLSWASNTTSPELADRFHIPMLNYAAHLAYLKDEASSLDPGRSVQFLQAFIREFDDNSAYTETRRNRSRGRTVKYAGL